MFRKLVSARDCCNPLRVSFISPFICMIILIPPSDSARIKFLNNHTLSWIDFSQDELKDFLLKIKDQEAFKLRNLLNMDYYIKWLFPKKRNYQCKAFTFDECAIKTLLESEKFIYDYIRKSKQVV
jgi:hypothetical protein